MGREVSTDHGVRVLFTSVTPSNRPKFGKPEKEYYPHLVVEGPEVAHVRQLEVAHLRAALLLREARNGVLVRVFPPVVQQQ